MIWSASADWGIALNSALSRALLYAGIIPAAAHMLECSIIHLMKTLLACWCGVRAALGQHTSWCEFAHDAG